MTLKLISSPPDIDRTSIGPYVVETVEVGPSTFETRVAWGEHGPYVEAFGITSSTGLEDAETRHGQKCDQVRAHLGIAFSPLILGDPPAA
jgi:hypothetical protein